MKKFCIKMSYMTIAIIMENVSTLEKFDLAQISDLYDELYFLTSMGRGSNIKNKYFSAPPPGGPFRTT